MMLFSSARSNPHESENISLTAEGGAVFNVDLEDPLE